MSLAGRRIVTAVMTLTLGVTACGLPIARPGGNGRRGPCGCGDNCRCSLASIVTGRCCCNEGLPTANACQLNQRAPQAAEPPAPHLPPCCAARQQAAATRNRPACCVTAASTGKTASEVKDAPRPDGAAAAPVVGCQCGPQPFEGWIVSADPRLAAGGVRMNFTAGLLDRLVALSEQGSWLRPAPDSPPPRNAAA